VEANALEEKKALANGFRDDGIFFIVSYKMLFIKYHVFLQMVD
jgi:hypothetical protein